MLQIQIHLWKQSSQNLETLNQSQSFNLSFLNLKNPNSLYASKGEKIRSSSSSTPNYVTNLLHNTIYVTPLLLCFHSLFSDHCQILYLLIINTSCRQCPSSFRFFPRAMMSFFLLTQKLKPKDVHGRSSNYTLGRVLGSTLHNIVLGGI